MKYFVFAFVILTTSLTYAMMQARKHTVNQSSGSVNLLPANENTGMQSRYNEIIQGNYRVIKTNSIPNHPVGAFPNSGNPHSISSQSKTYKVARYPKLAGKISKLSIAQEFGVALNGVSFDPGADEWYQGERNSIWQYEPLSGAIPLGVDANHAHVQPTGAYHYHGLPTNFLKLKGVQAGKPSPQIGWASDGFPIYALYGPNGKELRSSYQLKKGNRPSNGKNPGGKYDGTFLNDYQFVAGSGDLDQCNGTKIKTQDFPNGTYAYFLTKNYPVIPRCLMGEPDPSFSHKGMGKNNKRGRQSMRSAMGRGHGRGGPPQAAMDACSGKSNGASCSFQTPRGNLQGTCFEPPGQSSLACRPQHHRH